MTTAIIFLGCSTIMLIQKKTNTVGFTQFREQWKGILGVAILSILAIWSSDCSMMYIGVTLNQLLKACTPFPTMLFGMCIERKSFAWPIIAIQITFLVNAIYDLCIVGIPDKRRSVKTGSVALKKNVCYLVITEGPRTKITDAIRNGELGKSIVGKSTIPKSPKASNTA